VRQRTGADYGLAVAALPADALQQNTPSTDRRELQGILQVALAVGNNVRVKGFPLAGDPAIMIPRYAKHALDVLRLAMVRQAPD